jgi:hypothetical protein
MEHILELAAFGLDTGSLEELELTMKGNGTQECNLDTIVSGIIAPAQWSLQRLRLHFCAPIRLTHEWTPRQLRVGSLFEALATLHFPHLRDLDVARSFHGAATHSEEGALVRFIRTHA